ncbi:hypothetical protein Rhe02_02840 [Rhizocola hellebori]|uniref:Uncharacterized protein n=1 Tax=Rhizocola hellebori TaxID=1392758 RepID=A0A8J3VD81_9ACTN|nr:hypothetical protein Rhe02_02840 [Rhizocola hellebori]
MRIRRRIAAVAAVGLVAVLGVAASASPASAATYYIIQNEGSGLCLQAPPETPTDMGVQLVQEPCDWFSSPRPSCGS